MKKPKSPCATRATRARREAVGWLAVPDRDNEDEIQKACEELRDLAKAGDEWAAETLFQSALHSVTTLESACLDSPQVFTRLASHQMAWPALIGIHPDVARLGQKIIKAIQLGTKAALNQKGKTWSLETPEAAIAFQLWKAISLVRSGVPCAGGLPPLSRTNHTIWWRVAEPLFLKIHGIDFENHSAFARYWNGDAYKEVKPGHPSEKQLMQNARTLIRRDIKRNIKQAFRSIARKPSPV